MQRECCVCHVFPSFSIAIHLMHDNNYKQDSACKQNQQKTVRILISFFEAINAVWIYSNFKTGYNHFQREKG